MKQGDQIQNLITGERILFHKTSADTDGAAVVIETILRPYATGTKAHLHPAQEERFEVLEGSIGFQLGRQHLVAGPGHRLTLQAGKPHRLWNAGDEQARYLSEIRPALQFERLLATLFALASERETAQDRTPKLLRLAVIAHDHFDTARLPSPPAQIQRIALALAAALARRLGYQPTYNGHNQGTAAANKAVVARAGCEKSESVSPNIP